MYPTEEAPTGAKPNHERDSSMLTLEQYQDLAKRGKLFFSAMNQREQMVRQIIKAITRITAEGQLMIFTTISPYLIRPEQLEIRPEPCNVRPSN